MSVPTVYLPAIAHLIPLDRGHVLQRLPYAGSQQTPLTQEHFRNLLSRMQARLGANFDQINIRLPCFFKKTTTLSDTPGWLRHDTARLGQTLLLDRHHIKREVVIPASSFCFCAKQISTHGTKSTFIPISPSEEISLAHRAGCLPRIVRSAQVSG